MRAALMAQKTEMRLLGIVENMTSEVFGSGGGERLAEATGAPLLGCVPLDSALREAGDRGEPLVWSDPDAPASRAIFEIAEAVLAIEPERTRRDRQGAPPRRLIALQWSSASAGSASQTRTSASSRTTSSTPRLAASAATGSPESTGSRLLPGLDPSARPKRTIAEPGYERWEGDGALGYLTLAAICDAQLADPPARARVVVAADCFPTGMLGYWVRRLAEGGLVAALTATSPPRLAHPDGSEPLVGTTPLAIGIPSSDGKPLVADVSMGAVTHGDVIAGLASPDDLVPFGGEQAYKAFALAAGLQLLVDALAPGTYGALLIVARPEADPVPAFRRPRPASGFPATPRRRRAAARGPRPARRARGGRGEARAPA